MTIMNTTNLPRGSVTILTWLFRNHIWIFLGLVVLTFSLASPFFLTVNNISNVLTQGAFIGILAVGMTMVMIDGEIDLSVGATLALATALAIGLQGQVGIWPAVFFSLLSGAALGFLNGAITAYSGIHSFIVTLGALIGIRGLVFIYTGEDALMVQDFSYTEYAEIYLGPVSVTALIFFILALFFQWVLSSTRHGRETFAIGDNIEAAHDAGINIKRHKIINFTICGTMAAVAGILLSMRLGTAEPNAGKVWELWTIIAVVLGGTRLTGGFGSMWKTIGGVMTLAVLRNGLRLLNTPNYVELMVMGAVLILALLLDRFLAHKTEAR
ncbi:putative sugar ABC transporter permease protein [Octadecabacter antarcticus 307]|uniref:Putative sugar ABC transporter permease protein n=2 Tax=Octadecabacter TaxID=53945 RepID=M9RAV3_9RHOB|nr:putative sugar ABC transporter permease protein [Octadecabacter antarcticus 307]